MMKLNPITLNGTELKNNVLVAPLAGFTDFAFRYLCLSCGASLAFTEMVSAKGLYYNSQASRELLYVKGGGENAVQLFGNDAFFIRNAVESEYLAPFKIVDINMGCPVPKVNRSGSGPSARSVCSITRLGREALCAYEQGLRRLFERDVPAQEDNQKAIENK